MVHFGRRFAHLLAVLVLLSVMVGTSHAQGKRIFSGFEFEWERGGQAHADYLMAKADRAQRAVYEQLGVAPRGSTRVVLSESSARMQERAQAEQGGTPPEWADGLAYPSRKVIYLNFAGPVDELEQTFVHELSHIALGGLDEKGLIPRWLSEGIAIWQSETWSFERIHLLTEAAAMDRLHSLANIERGFPENAQRAGVAYAQAVHFVGFLNQYQGPQKFHQLLRALRDGADSFPNAIESVYGVSLSTLEREWTSQLRVRWGWVSVVFSENTLWIFASFLLILGWRRRRQERQRRLSMLKAREEASDLSAIRSTVPAQEMIEQLDPYDGKPPTYH